MQAQLGLLLVILLAVVFTIASSALTLTVHTVSGPTMVDTITGLIGMLAAFAFAERLSSTRQLRDLLLALALGIFGATDLVHAAEPTLINTQPGDSWWWIVLTGRLVAGGILIAAAFCPAVDLDRSRRLTRTIVVVAGGALVAIAAVLLALNSHLPSLLESTRGSTGTGEAHVRPLLSYLQLVGALLAGIAAVGLARHSTRQEDGLERTIAAGIAVLAIARFNYFLVPSMSNNRLYAGDILKLGAFMLILYGCLIEFRAIQRKLVKRVAVDERRRMARDMHDGLAQELAFIATHSQRLRHTGEDATTVAHLQSAAERALHDSRTTIAVLTAAEDVPLDQLILRTVESVRSRFGVEVEVELKHDLVVGAEERNALLRILHEALINAVRHGSAQQIFVRLSDGSRAGGPSLRITDDGSGFDVPGAVNAGKGLGLTSMQERAGILGGTLSIASRPGAGTVVEVELP
ncbi:MAG TPA: ATP-binding protein [Solirubrobacteraceae bacterium]